MRLRVSARIVPLRSLSRLQTVMGETPAAAATWRMVTRPGGVGFCNRRLMGSFMPTTSLGPHDSACRRQGHAAKQGLPRDGDLHLPQIGLEGGRIHIHAQAWRL